MAFLDLKNIRFSYPEGQQVFQNLSLAVEQGEVVAVVGPSGCGKSTLLNLLSGFYTADQGHITLAGQAIAPESSALGYVFQSPDLFPWLSALDNVRFGLRMAGKLPLDEQRALAARYLALVGLADASDKLPHQLSGGMQQRVALARSLIMQPQLLLMDEPFAALDAITRNDMNEELLRIRSELGQTVLFITHDIEEAVFLADRVVVLGTAPAGIQQVLDINLPQPRRQRETRQLPAFQDYCAQLRVGIAGAVLV
jgi:NitT/TauT family transport system ATP-binding protein